MKHLATLLLAVLAAGPIHAWAADVLQWNEQTELPPNPGQIEQLGVAGPFVGIHNDHLIVAGGANFPKPVWESEKVWQPFAWAYDLKDGNWAGQISTLENGGVEYRVAYGASASTSRGVACLGGNDGQTVFENAFLLRLENGGVLQKPLPDLPGPLCYSGAAAVEDVIYVAGGTTGLQLETAAGVFWKLDLGRKNPEGESLPWPKAVPERAFHMLVAQKHATHDCLYIIGGRRIDPDAEGGVEFLTDVWEHNLVTGAWRRCSDLPEPRASGACAVIAAVVGISLSMYLKFGDVPLHGKLFGGIGIATTVLLGYLLGFVVRGDETKTQGLTIYSLRPDLERRKTP